MIDEFEIKGEINRLKEEIKRLEGIIEERKKKSLSEELAIYLKEVEKRLKRYKKEIEDTEKELHFYLVKRDIGIKEIRIREEVILSGRDAKSVIKTRVGLRDRATSDVYNVTEGNAPNVRGHVDCIEIVSGDAKATATPIVSVSNETARVTHEAAIGSVDRKQLDTLMAHGLSRKEAIDTILRAMLK